MARGAHRLAVRRPAAGKATLARELGDGRTLFLNCEPLRTDDCGLLWEHIVLEHLQAHFPDTPVRYWRDKQGHEVDFVMARGRDEVDVIECKWNAGAFDAAALAVFRSYYPKGRNYLASPSGAPGYTKRFGSHEVLVCTPPEITESSWA